MAKTIEERNREKKACFDDWMKGDHVLVQIDARGDTVIVPENLKEDSALTLKLSYLFQGKTLADEEKITSYLLFGDQYFECVLPWDLIWGVRSCSGEQKVWNEDIPKEVVTRLARETLADLGRRFFGSKDAKEESAASTDTETKSKSHLKRIK